MRRAIVELLIQGPAAAQHAIEDLGGDPARGKTGRINSGCARGHALNGQWRNPRVSGSVVELSTARCPAVARIRAGAGSDYGPECTGCPARGDDYSLSAEPAAINPTGCCGRLHCPMGSPTVPDSHLPAG